MQQEVEQENQLQKIDEAELLEIRSKNKSDDNKEAWDEVPEKVEDVGDDEEKEKVVQQVEIERLPRVAKPVGDVFEKIMQLDIGQKNVILIAEIENSKIENLLKECISRVQID